MSGTFLTVEQHMAVVEKLREEIERLEAYLLDVKQAAVLAATHLLDEEQKKVQAEMQEKLGRIEQVRGELLALTNDIGEVA